MKSGLAQPAIKRISKALSKTLPNFDNETFESSCLAKLETLELKERVTHIINVLHQHLPSDFIQTANLLTKIPAIWDFGDPDDALKSFAAWPLIDYFSEHGLEHPETSLNALKQLTHLFSAEFAIRPFIVKYPDYCHEQFLHWITDESEHVRRLVSEGTRPKLPWGIQLKSFVKHPEVNIPLLDALKADTSLYVRRSVANHLNDITKDHPNLVINTCKEWKELKNKDVNWVIKHATRTLVKAGNTDVFPLLGFTENPEITLESFKLSTQQLSLGEAITFDFTVKSTSKKKQSMVVDYAIYFVKANGQQQAKVFKLKNITLTPNESLAVNKSFSFKAISTRKYYAGEHKVALLVNGKILSTKTFMVTD